MVTRFLNYPPAHTSYVSPPHPDNLLPVPEAIILVELT